MAARTVAVGLMTYRGPNDPVGLWRTAGFGDEVDVHEDDLGRFDSLNGWASSAPAPIIEPEPVEPGPAEAAPDPDPAPEPEAPEPQAPARTARK